MTINQNHWVSDLRKIAYGKVKKHDSQNLMTKKEVDALFNKERFKNHFEDGMTPSEAFADAMEFWAENK